MTLKVFTAFSGYDSQCMALDRLHRHNPDFNYELVGWAEIDKYAIAAHNAVYPQWAERNYGDISKIDWQQVPDFDLFTYSSPCQDFSQAGKQAGGTEGSGTRSSLLWECRRAILAKKPKYLLMENVAALVSQKFIRLFNAWQLELESYGYRNFAKVLNAKDYGVPQNRERIFMVSVLDEQARYEFPDPMPLPLRLKDILEPKVDERYYLSTKTIEMFDNHKAKQQALGRGFGWMPTEGDGTAFTIKASSHDRADDNYIKEPIPFKQFDKPQGDAVKVVGELNPQDRWGKCIRQQNFVIGVDGCSMSITAKHLMHDFKVAEPVIGAFRGRNPENPSERARSNGRYKQRLELNENGTSNTLTGVQKDNMVIEPSYRIRKLTERECFRLMDVPEEYIDRIQAAGISRSQQYKMAGNSIVVSCMYHIWRKLWIDTQIKTLTLF